MPGPKRVPGLGRGSNHGCSQLEYYNKDNLQGWTKSNVQYAQNPNEGYILMSHGECI